MGIPFSLSVLRKKSRAQPAAARNFDAMQQILKYLDKMQQALYLAYTAFTRVDDWQIVGPNMRGAGGRLVS